MFQIDIEKRVGDFLLRPAFEAGDEMVVLFGPSGCGKSLTLRAVAGPPTLNNASTSLIAKAV